MSSVSRLFSRVRYSNRRAFWATTTAGATGVTGLGLFYYHNTNARQRSLALSSSGGGGIGLSEDEALRLYYEGEDSTFSRKISTIAGAIFNNGLAHLDSPKRNSSVDSHPSTLWTPPTRAQMIEALKKSSTIPRSSEYGEWYKGIEEGTGGGTDAGVKGDDDDEDGYDLLIIGGGATGAGTALDAASRGLKVAMVERDDFSSGTSSKSTKLVHGGVRYLQKAVMELDYEQWKLVREALSERKTFLHIAPYLSHQLPIMLPIYKWWQIPYYYAGTKMYDILAGGENMESSYVLSKSAALGHFPMLKSENLVGAVVYHDGQHNDSRMNMALVMSAVHHGAVTVNHCEVVKLHRKPDSTTQSGDKLCGARVRDAFTGEEWDVKAKGIINATGPFCDAVRRMEDPSTPEIVAPSGGVHVTLPNYYSQRTMGLLDPSTSDGRVIFFLPWLGNTIAGTTDSPTTVTQNPTPSEEEIQWILGEVRNYLNPDVRVRRGDVLSAWSGIRPLVRDPKAKNSQSLVRNHMINIGPSGLLTIAGGKWTTYRAMAEETVDSAIEAFNLQPKRPCPTRDIRLVGSHGWSKLMFVKLIQHFGLETEVAKHLADTYGDRAWAVCSIATPTGKRWPVHGTRLDPNYPFLRAEVIYAARREFASTAVDIVARRTRLSFLNAQAALEALPQIIDIMAEELKWDKKRQQQEFVQAKDFLRSMGIPEACLGVTLDELKKGKRLITDDSDSSFSRAVFSSQELDQLLIKFKNIDVDSDGCISTKDLKQAMRRMGYGDVPASTWDEIMREVDANSDGKIEFKEFLEAAAGAKEVRLHTAFSRLVEGYEPEDPNVVQDKPAGTPTSTQTPWVGKRIPVEKSGGGV